MPYINYANGVSFVFDDNTEKIIINNNLLNNLNSVPLGIFETNKRSLQLQSFINRVVSEYPEIAIQVKNPMDPGTLLLTVSLFISHAMQRDTPRRLLEIGCRTGILSYFLAKAARLFNEENKVTCLTESIGSNESGSFLSRMGGNASALDFRTENLTAPTLPDHFFDCTFINGTEFIQEPSDVIQNAIRVTRDGGLLVCITEKQYLLHSCFYLYLEDFDEYPIEEAKSVLVATIRHDSYTRER